MASGKLCIHYRDKVNDDVNENNAANYRINNKNTTANKYFFIRQK